MQAFFTDSKRLKRSMKTWLKKRIEKPHISCYEDLGVKDGGGEVMMELILCILRD